MSIIISASVWYLLFNNGFFTTEQKKYGRRRSARTRALYEVRGKPVQINPFLPTNSFEELGLSLTF